MNNILKNNLALLAMAIALLSAPEARAQVLAFDVNLNTAALAAQDSANAPFYLDFQLNYGSTPEPSNTVNAYAFLFTGGSALGTATTSGTASGSLNNSLSLTASSSSQLNELYQQFSPGTTNINFQANITEAGSGATPTSFTIAIMDNSLGSPAQLYTNAPDQASMVVLNLSPSNTLANIGAFSSVSSADGNTLISGVSSAIAVPEPSTTAAIVGCAVLPFAFCARRFRKPQLAPQVA